MAVAVQPLRKRRPRDVGIAFIGLGVAVAVLYFGRLFFITLISAVIVAFLLDPAVVLLGKLRVPRATASFLVCALALLLVYLAGLGLYTQVAELVEDLPKYQQRVNDLVDRVLARIESIEQSVYQLVVPKRFREQEKVEAPPSAPAPSARRARAPAVPLLGRMFVVVRLAPRPCARGTAAASRAGGAHSAGAASFVHLPGRPCRFFLRSRSDGFLRAVFGVFHVELAGAYTPPLPGVVR